MEIRVYINFPNGIRVDIPVLGTSLTSYLHVCIMKERTTRPQQRLREHMKAMSYQPRWVIVRLYAE